jgi:hypothetical protein
MTRSPSEEGTAFRVGGSAGSPKREPALIFRDLDSRLRCVSAASREAKEARA